ncbi:MAG: ATP-binding cassette domain-containing protein, partial [Bacteroidia bacterium]|nr:ATP-binding cassette domain-containing protein [Bacteroidia bacterium]
ISDLSEKALGSLSGGQKQKVGAYIAFLFNPEIIILDEPTAGLDPVSTEIIKEKIIKSKKEGKLIVITTHIMQDADELSDRLIYLMEGKIFIDMKIEQLKEQTRENTLNKALAKKISEYEKQ